MQRYNFTLLTETEVVQEIVAAGLTVLERHVRGLDVLTGSYSDCFFMADVVPALPVDPRIAEFEALVAQQDNKILDLTYENILLQEGLL